ncbi:MAG: hypothetical protein L0K86_16870 [Actinomycetia bacterium]|nr:hypothetical protein [Actinomycetes bacterium]
MRGPFGARLEVPGKKPVDVSEILDDFTYRVGVPGGFLGASGKLWASIDDYGLTEGSRLIISNGTDASTLWEGHLDSPGEQFDETGEAFDLSAQGAMTLASDQAEPLLYLDSQLGQWRADDLEANNIPKAAQASKGTIPETTTEALVLEFPSGSVIGAGDQARIIHDLAERCPMGLGGYFASVRSGIDSANYELRVTVEGNSVIETLSMQTGAIAARGVRGSGTWQAFGRVLKFRLVRTGGATTVGTDNIWSAWSNVIVAGNRRDRFGEETITPATTLNSLRAWEVVEDLVYRLMPMVDPNRSRIFHGDYDIDQLVYPEPARAAGVLDDLSLFEPDFYWRFTASAPDGRFGFTYDRWPSTPRYEISIQDGYSAPGSDASQANRVTVVWTDKGGRERTEVATLYVPALGGTPDNPTRDRTVDAEQITLPEQISSQANATRIANQWLRIVNEPAQAASATVVRRVRDLVSGGWISPWEMQPGNLVRVRESGKNHRLTELEVDTDALSVGLTLGHPKPTIEQLVARLSEPSRRRRR